MWLFEKANFALIHLTLLVSGKLNERYFASTECSLRESDVYLVTCVPNFEWYSIFRE